LKLYENLEIFINTLLAYVPHPLLITSQTPIAIQTSYICIYEVVDAGIGCVGVGTSFVYS